MAHYQGQGAGQTLNQRINYQTNLDPNLLATIRGEMMRKEEEQRRAKEIEELRKMEEMRQKEEEERRLKEEKLKEIMRKEFEKKRATEMVTQMQSMLRRIPDQYKQKLSYDILYSLAISLMDGTVFEIVKGLEDIQQLSERNLLNKRMKVINSHKAQRMDMSKQHKAALLSCQQSQHNLPLVERKNLEEKENLEKCLEKELTQLDQKLVLELDQLVTDQQTTLQRAGVPLFHVTNKPEEARLQMYIIEFITRLAPSN